jgi:hypothetical protein
MTLSVQSGVFSASLPWSPSLFPGSARWIEVRVRPTPSGGGSISETVVPYAVLERQRIQVTPYALRSLSSATVESVPVQSLPASVPLIGSSGKLDSTLLASDIARSSEISAALSSFQVGLQQVVAKSEASQAVLTSQLAALAQDAPTPRYDASGAWTGEELVVFGGNTSSSTSGSTATGAAWRPGTGLRPLPAPAAGLVRSAALSAWTVSSLLVFGGVSPAGLPLADLQRLEVRSPWYLYRRGALPNTTSSASNP